MTPSAIPCAGQTLTGALDPRTLDAIVRRIVEVADPEKIILFGSAARGEMTRHSDVDLLVVKEVADRRDLSVRIRRRLYGIDAAVDVIVVTPWDIERYGDSHALVIKPALRDGKVVYAFRDPFAGRATSRTTPRRRAIRESTSRSASASTCRPSRSPRPSSGGPRGRCNSPRLQAPA